MANKKAAKEVNKGGRPIKEIEESWHLRTKSPLEIEIGLEEVPYLPRVKKWGRTKIHFPPCGCEECRNRPETPLRKMIKELIEEKMNNEK